MELDPHKALNRFKPLELGLVGSSNALGHSSTMNTPQHSSRNVYMRLAIST